MKLVIFYVLVISLLFAALEFGALLLNRRSGETTYPFFFNTPERSTGPIRNADHIPTTFLDPQLGYAHDPETDFRAKRGWGNPRVRDLRRT